MMKRRLFFTTGILLLFTAAAGGQSFASSSFHADVPVTIFLSGFYTSPGQDYDKMAAYLASAYKRSCPEWQRKLSAVGFQFRHPRVNGGSNSLHPACFIPDLTDRENFDVNAAREAENLYDLIQGRTGENNPGMARAFRERFGVSPRITFVATSAGALKLREYIRLCGERGVPDYADKIFFIAGAHNGSDIAADKEAFFGRVLYMAVQKIKESAKTNACVTLDTGGGKRVVSYREIYDQTILASLDGDSWSAVMCRKLLAFAVINWVPFDNGHTLGGMTVLGQLAPGSAFIKRLEKMGLPEDVKVINLVSRCPSSGLFRTSARAMENAGGPALSDGFLTAENSLLAGKNVTEIVADRPADHCDLIALDAVQKMPELVGEKYGLLRLVLKDFGAGNSDAENRLMIRAFFTAVIAEVGYDGRELGEKGNYSILDYFIEKDLLCSVSKEKNIFNNVSGKKAMSRRIGS